MEEFEHYSWEEVYFLLRCEIPLKKRNFENTQKQSW